MGVESRIEPGSTPGAHFSLLHSPGLLSVGAFLLLLPLAVPHNLAPSVTLSRISSSLPRPRRREVAINSDRSQSLRHRCEERPRRFLSPNLSQEAGSREFSKTVQDREGGDAKPKPHSPRLSDCRRLSLALHLYRLLYAAFDSSQRSHSFQGQEIVGTRAKAVSYQIIRQRNNLHVIATRCSHYRHDSTPRYSSRHRPLAIERRHDSGFTGLFLSCRVLTALARSPVLPGPLKSTEPRADGQPLPRCCDRPHPYRSCSW